MTETKRGRPRKTDDETETKAETKPQSTTVAMTRELQPGESGPTTADVHRDEVDNWKLEGWREA